MKRRTEIEQGGGTQVVRSVTTPTIAILHYLMSYAPTHGQKLHGLCTAHDATSGYRCQTDGIHPGIASIVRVVPTGTAVHVAEHTCTHPHTNADTFCIESNTCCQLQQ